LPKNGKLFLAPPTQDERGVEKVSQSHQERVVVRKTGVKNGALTRSGLQEITEY